MENDLKPKFLRSVPNYSPYCSSKGELLLLQCYYRNNPEKTAQNLHMWTKVELELDSRTLRELKAGHRSETTANQTPYVTELHRPYVM